MPYIICIVFCLFEFIEVKKNLILKTLSLKRNDTLMLCVKIWQELMRDFIYISNMENSNNIASLF